MDERAPQHADAMNCKQVKHLRTGYLCLSTGSLLVLGLLYAWSIFAVPLGYAFGWDRSQLSYVFSISMTSFCIGALAGSFFARWWSTRASLMVAAVLQLSGFVLTAFLAWQGIWALYLFYGVFAGFACGVGYNTVVSTVNLWFPDRVGLSAGTLMMGFGLGSLIFGSTVNAAIDSFGWEAVFMAIGCIGASTLVVLAAVIRMPPSDIGDVVGTEQVKRRRASRVQVEKRPMLRSPLFYLYFIWAVLLVSASLTLIGDSKQGALIVGVDPAMATLLVGLVSLANGTARLVIGMVFDKSDLRTAMLLTTSVAIVAYVLLTVSYAYSLPLLYYAAAIIAGFSAGGSPVLASSFARERFAARDFPRNLAIVNFNLAFSALISSIAVTVGRSLGGDVAVYAILSALTVLALGIAFIFFKVYYRSSNDVLAKADGGFEALPDRP